MDENCYVEPIYKNSISAEQLEKADRATLLVSGMGCQNCATRIRNSLLSLEGVHGVDVYLNMALAEVRYDSQKISLNALVDAVSHAGNDGHHQYGAEVIASK